jgi:tocopherol O-methyltransferase
VLKPGGRLVVFAWLAGEAPTPWQVKHLLEPICSEGRLPSMGSASDYRALGEAAGFTVDPVADISRQVRRTWTICIQRVLGRLTTDAEARRLILDSAQHNRVFAITLVRIMAAYRTGAMRYGVFVMTKPDA